MPMSAQNTLFLKDLKRSPDRVTRDIQISCQQLLPRKGIAPLALLNAFAQVGGDPFGQ